MLLLLFVFVVVDVVSVVSRINGYQQGVFWKLKINNGSRGLTKGSEYGNKKHTTTSVFRGYFMA